MEIKIGDYVLATKWRDGDPRDYFCVGFVSSFLKYGGKGVIRFNVTDSQGKPFRGNGFRRVRKITPQEGMDLIDRFPVVSDTPGVSIWSHLGQIRRQNRAGNRSKQHLKEPV